MSDIPIADDALDDIQFNDDDYITLATYPVDGDQIGEPHMESIPDDLASYQQDLPAQRGAWEIFAALIPPDQRGSIEEYQAFTDGPGDLLAAVEQTQDNPYHWALQVDVADAGDTHNLTYTLIHEFGHLLTLNPSQVPPDIALFNDPENETLYDQESAACPYYFPGEGCSQPQSYINAFFDRFWADIYDDWQEVDSIEDDNTYYDEIHNFYERHQDQFVTDYAVTNTSEDIAESWVFFVLSPKPAGDSIAEEKILFFYEYPELVQLRAQIQQNLCAIQP